MDCALLDGLINHRNCLADAAFNSLSIALGDSIPQTTEGSAQPRLVGAIHLGAFFRLTGALERRKMVCHCVLMLPFEVLDCLNRVGFSA